MNRPCSIATFDYRMVLSKNCAYAAGKQMEAMLSYLDWNPDSTDRKSTVEIMFFFDS